MNKNLYMLKPNSIECGFAPFLLKEINLQYKITEIRVVNFNNEQAKKFYHNAYINHLNKYGDNIASEIRERNAKFISSNSNIMLVIEPKFIDDLKMSAEEFIESSRLFAEDLRKTYNQNHNIYKTAANTIHASDSLDSFYQDMENLKSTSKPLIHNNISNSSIDYDIFVTKYFGINEMAFISTMFELLKKSEKINATNEIFIQSLFLNFIEKPLNCKNYVFQNEKIYEKINFFQEKLKYCLNQTIDYPKYLKLSQSFLFDNQIVSNKTQQKKDQTEIAR